MKLEAIFGKRNKKEEKKTQVVSEPTATDISNDVMNINAGEEILNGLIDKLSQMNSGVFRSKVLEAAEKNDARVKAYYDWYDNEMKTAKGAKKNVLEQSRRMSEGLPINYQRDEIKGGYEAEENRLYFLTDEVAEYQNIPLIMKKILENYSGADVNRTGAVEILPYLQSYLKQLESALEKGHKLKADVCKMVFKYVVTVVLKDEPNRTEEENKKLLEHRKAVLKDTFNTMIRTVNSIYSDIQEFKRFEQKSKTDFALFSKTDAELRAMPENMQQDIDEIGFEEMLEQNPGDETVASYMDTFLQAKREMVHLRYSTFIRTTLQSRLLQKQEELGELINEVISEFNTLEEGFTMEELSQQLERATSHRIVQIEQENAAIHADEERINQLSSEIDAMRKSPIKGIDANRAADMIKEFRRMQQLDEERIAEIEKRKAELEKQEAMKEREQQKIKNTQQREMLGN